MTRIRNQISENNPASGSSHSNQKRFLSRPMRLPVMGQRRGVWIEPAFSLDVSDIDEMVLALLKNILHLRNPPRAILGFCSCLWVLYHRPPEKTIGAYTEV
jgi:hypothetical protein